MPIPGLRRVQQVQQAAAALAWQLSEAERLELDGVAFGLPPQARMPANPFQSA
jgi:aryl-alcohol dehydrogenase-like predicted oxidoreductase